MADIDITVTGTPPKGTYTSSNPLVATNGDIEVPKGTKTIRFLPGHGVTWEFEADFITFVPPGPFTVTTEEPEEIEIEDVNPGTTKKEYKYTLHTTEGDFDPKIINRGTVFDQGPLEPVPPGDQD